MRIKRFKKRTIKSYFLKNKFSLNKIFSSLQYAESLYTLNYYPITNRKKKIFKFYIENYKNDNSIKKNIKSYNFFWKKKFFNRVLFKEKLKKVNRFTKKSYLIGLKKKLKKTLK